MSEDKQINVSGDGDALLPGKGNSPSYGINDSCDESSMEDSGRTAPSVIQSIVHPPAGERVWVVAMCSLIACIAAVINGMVIAYSSPTLSILGSEEQKKYNPDQYIAPGSDYGSLFGAFGAVGAIFGGPVAWPLSEKFGRQASLMLSGIPSLTGWILIANAHSCSSREGFLTVLLIGRLLSGFAVGWAIFGISVYISEVASAKLKGLFGNCNQLFLTIGTLFVNVAGITFNGYQLPYWIVALIAGCIVVVFEFLMLFTYETPRWHFSKGNEFQGIHVLKVLRGPNAHISKEIDHIRHALRKTYTFTEQLLEFKNRSVYMPFIVVLFLMLFQQFSGINAAVFYAAPILEQTQFKPVEANIIAAAAVGVTQVVATFFAVILVDLLGRRVLLVVSGIGMALSSGMLCIYFSIYHRVCGGCVGNQTVEHCISPHDYPPCNVEGVGIGAMAILAVVVFIASFSLGWGPLPWSLMSEILPHRVRALAGSIATFVNWIFASIVTVGYHYYADGISSEFAWLTFAIVMILSIIFVILFVPETKGHSLEEIQEHFEKGEIFALSFLHKKSETRRRTIENDHPSRLSVTSVSGYGDN